MDKKLHDAGRALRVLVALLTGLLARTPALAETADRVPADSFVLQVYRVGQRTNFYEAHKGQTITVVVTNLEAFLSCNVVSNDLRERKIPASSASMVPFINNIPLVGCKMLFDTVRPDNTHELTFKLVRDASDQASKDHWKEFFSSIPLFEERAVAVSVGFTDGWVMDSEVGPHGSAPKFIFEALPVGWASFGGFAVILLALVVFFWLAANTEIIRDPFAPLRPDGSVSFSLARTQMAFWFFLVISSYFLLWLLTDDKDTIPASVLILIGISAGTALGAAFVDGNKTNEDGRSQFLVKREQDQSVAQVIQQLVAAKQAQLNKLFGILKTLETLPATALVDRDNAQKEQCLTEQMIQRIDVQTTYYKGGPFSRFLIDILGDDGVVSFHRFQIAAWTLVLGVIFVVQVLTQISMPDFSATLLGLMGISGGTYVGFKIPGSKN